MQFYFLSVVINLLAGILLAGDYLAQRFPGLKALLPELSTRASGVTIGAITAGVGVLKLFVYADPRQIVLAGDLLPAVAGIVLGGVLIGTGLSSEEEDSSGVGAMEKPIHTSKEGSSRVVAADGPLVKAVQASAGFRVPVGLAGIAVALLHFLFPGAVLL